MKKIQEKTTCFFVDESGDPTFYDRSGKYVVGTEGVSKILILGFVKVSDPKSVRKSLEDVRKEISSDKYLRGIPSLEKSLISFHAKDDCNEVREKVFKEIIKLDFSAEIFVARKVQNIFNAKYHRNENEFYDDLVTRLFQNKLHLARYNEIYFSVRGSKTRQAPLEHAIRKAVGAFETKWNTKIDSETKIIPQSPLGEPCLQVIDYINWTVQRAFVKGEERYFKFIEDKISYLVDMFDTVNYPKNFYNRSNKFEVKKISPL